MTLQTLNTILVLLNVKIASEINEIKRLAFRMMVYFIQKIILTLIKLKLSMIILISNQSKGK